MSTTTKKPDPRPGVQLATLVAVVGAASSPPRAAVASPPPPAAVADVKPLPIKQKRDKKAPGLPAEVEAIYQKMLKETTEALSGAESNNLESYWLIGEKVSFVLHGSFADRYGQKIIKRLSDDLQGSSPVGVSVTNLRGCSRFYNQYTSGVPNWFREVKVSWRTVIQLFRPSVDSPLRDSLLRQLQAKEITPKMAVKAVHNAGIPDVDRDNSPSQRSDKFLSKIDTLSRQYSAGLEKLGAHAERFARLPVDDRRNYLKQIDQSIESLRETADLVAAAIAQLNVMGEQASPESTKTMARPLQELENNDLD